MKRYVFLILFLGIFFSWHCASSNPDKDDKSNSYNKDTGETKPFSPPINNEEELEIKLKEAFSVVYQSFKNGILKASIMAREGKTLFIVARQTKDGGAIVFYEGSENLKNPPYKDELGKEIECINLPSGITFLEPQRVFWYTGGGNIDFSEDDVSLEREWSKVGDLTLVPVSRDMSHIRGIIDIDKQKVRILFQEIDIGRN